jgi:hypothetical protein
VSAELQGLDAFNRKADAIAAGVEARAREVAAATADRVGGGVRARVRHAARARLQAAVRVIEQAASKQFVVGFDDAALFASGLFPMVAVWHEFGTRFKSPNPAVGDALGAERARYISEMREAVTSELQEGSL